MTNQKQIQVSWEDLQTEQKDIPFDETQDIRVKRAKIKLQKEKPFFSDLLFFIKIKQESRVPTFGVDLQGTLYYNPVCSKSLTDDELKGVLIHEVLHLALHHTARGLNKRLTKGKLPPHEIWNLAIDCQANLISVQNGQQLPKWIGCVPVGTSVELRSKTGVIYKVDEVDKKTSEEIYIELYNNLPKKYVDSFEFGDGEGVKGLDEHFYSGNEKEAEKSEREWKQRALNALYRSKSIGNLPAGMERLINDLIEPKIPWTSKLYKFITDDIINDYTYCLDKDTDINTENGFKKLNDLKVGDVVLGFNGEVVKTLVLNKFENINKNEVYIFHTKKGRRIVCSGEHKFYIDGKFVKAKDIKSGDVFTTL